MFLLLKKHETRGKLRITVFPSRVYVYNISAPNAVQPE